MLILSVLNLSLCLVLSCHSRLGVFDWVLGRPTATEAWGYNQRFVREFTGMSLRGLLWTVPAGYLLYLLGFGWQYSLSGSQMGLYYYLGGVLPDPGHNVNEKIWANFVGLIPHSELMWGAFIWYVLFVSCMVELTKRRRNQLEKRYTNIRLQLNSKLFRCCANDCLSIKCISFLYQVCVVFVVVISLCSVVYYAAVEQADLANKMQTFTGLFIGTILLVLALGCSWGYWCGRWPAAKRQTGAPQTNPAPRPERYPLLQGNATTHVVANDYGSMRFDGDNRHNIDDYEAVCQEQVNAGLVEDRDGVQHVVGVRRYVLGVRQIPRDQCRQLNRLGILDYYWILFETVLYLDVFAILHFFNGLVFALSTAAVIVMTFMSLVWNIHTPRYFVGNCTTGAAI